MKSAMRLVLGGLLLWASSGCGAAPAAPTATSPSAASPSRTLAGNLSGTWNGSSTDAQGAALLTWILTQTGSAIAGDAVMEPANRGDGSCGSCHKQKHGTVSGTISGTSLSLTLAFPAGGNDETPLCGITLNAATSDVAPGRIAAAYTGTTTCEGPIADGALIMNR